jgi:hypothetical protein
MQARMVAAGFRAFVQRGCELDGRQHLDGRRGVGDSGGRALAAAEVCDVTDDHAGADRPDHSAVPNDAGRALEDRQAPRAGSAFDGELGYQRAR